uniref:HAT C-terminal dimerisation domain-containing protein n=1 Tax=Astyanax mexicanus TaxID=7994 RepID=A0A3B1IKL0_ASTMX
DSSGKTVKGKNVHVEFIICPLTKNLSTSCVCLGSQTELNGLIEAYTVENMLPILTVESDSFRALTGKIPRKVGAAHNKSYLGVTAHWTHPANLQQKKPYGISQLRRMTLWMRKYKVTFVDDVLQSRVDEDDDVINLPPHYRCASHTEPWILSRQEKAVYRSATAKCTALWNKASRSTVAAETVEDVVAKKMIMPCMDLNNISSMFGSKAITEKEHQLLKEYCIAMKPRTVALDILQQEDNCYPGTLLPTLETLMMKTLKLKSGLQILVDLPEAIVEAIKARFTEVLNSDSALLAAVILPRFKLLCVRNEDQQKGTSTTTPTCTNSTVEDAFFSTDDEDNTSATVESQVADHLKSGAEGMDSLHGFPLIKRIYLKYNATTSSSTPVERLFILGKLVFTPKKNRLSDLKFEGHLRWYSKFMRAIYVRKSVFKGHF